MKRKISKYNDYKTEIQWANEGFVRFPESEGVKLQANSHGTSAVYFAPDDVYFVGKGSDLAKSVLESFRKKNSVKRSALIKKNEDKSTNEMMDAIEERRKARFERTDNTLFLDDKNKRLSGPCDFFYNTECERLFYLLDGVDERIPCSRAIYETMSFEEREELEVFGGDEDIPWYDEEYYERMWREKTYSVEANYHHWYEEEVIRRHH